MCPYYSVPVLDTMITIG